MPLGIVCRNDNKAVCIVGTRESVAMLLTK